MQPTYGQPFNPDDLRQFTGTDHYYRYGPMCKQMLLTDGVQFLMLNGAAWLVDVIASYQHTANVKKEPFQVWRAKVNSDKSCDVQCDDGNTNIIVTQHVEFTDLPCDVVLYYIDNVLLLSNEY